MHEKVHERASTHTHKTCLHSDGHVKYSKYSFIKFTCFIQCTAHTHTHTHTHTQTHTQTHTHTYTLFLFLMSLWQVMYQKKNNTKGTFILLAQMKKHAHMCLHVHTGMHECTRAHTHTLSSKCPLTSILMDQKINNTVLAAMNKHAHLHAKPCVCTCTHAYMCIHTHTHTHTHTLLLQMLDGDARHLNKSCCPLQSLQFTKELVPQRGARWPCFSPDTIEWAVLEQVLASHLGCATRAAGQSWAYSTYEHSSCCVLFCQITTTWPALSK